MSPPENDLLRKARERMAAQGLLPTESEPEPTSQPEFDSQDAPDIEPYERTPEDEELDQVLAGITIVQAYHLWCGKMEPPSTNRSEGIKVSCPNPSHPDHDPSAWLNTEKDVYFCGGCQEGGDKFDIAAWHFGYDVPGYKKNGSFPELRRKMASELGFTVKKTLGGQTYVESPDAVPAQQRDGSTTDTDSEPPLATVIQLPPPPDMPTDFPGIDWKSLVQPDTFMWEWLSATASSDLPPEYYFWLGMQAIGFAIGDEIVLHDAPPVKGNLFVCLYGPSGLGKSKAIATLRELLKESAPYGDAPSRGTKIVPQPGSPEALIDSFSEPTFDPGDPSKKIGMAPVRGLVRFDELATLIKRAERTGSAFKPVLMEFYDAYDDVTHHTRGSGSVIACQPFCQAITSTQPEVISNLLMQEDADSGFINRWVFAAGPTTSLYDWGQKQLDLTSAVGKHKTLMAWALNHKGNVQLSDEARDLWREFFYDEIAPMKQGGKSPILNRLDLTLKKSLLLMSANDLSMEVSAERMEKVLTLAAYLKNIYKTLSGQIGLGQFEACRANVLAVIRERTAVMKLDPTSRDISRYVSTKFARDLVLRVLKTLVELGEVEETVVKPKAGRSATRYSVVG